MNHSEYRREYAAYCSALERERYKYHAGLAPELRLHPIADRYADLHTQHAVDGLQRWQSETPIHFETERAGLKFLIDAARLGFVESYTRELADELARCESATRIEWEGAPFTASDMLNQIVCEPDAARRHKLTDRWYDALRQCDDLRTARLEANREAAGLLGFDSYRKLHEEVASTDYEKLATGFGSFLQRSASVYGSRLAQWATAHKLSFNASGTLRYADSFSLRRIQGFDDFFSAHELRATYGGALGGLGTRVEKQPNLLVDDEARPLKKAHSACFAVDPPDEVRLVVNVTQRGAAFYQNFFKQVGRAQHLAWSSRDFAARHPEFIHAPDGTTCEGFAFLFSYLFLDAAWLSEYKGLRETSAREVARQFALLEMHDVRLNCAQLRYQIALHDAADVRSEHLSEIFTSLYNEAAGFQYDPAMRLLEAGDGFRAASALRARLFAVAISEHLRTRYGHRWWAMRGAGDELIDMWNTSSRYSVEELAHLIGAGSLNIDLLAETLLVALNDA